MSPPASPRRSDSSTWHTHRAQDQFLNLDVDERFAMRLLRLERLLKNDAMCCTSRAELLDVLRCSEHTLTAFLRKAEKGDENGPWFTRIEIPYSRENGFTQRIGIIPHRRPTDRPVVPHNAASMRRARAQLKRGGKPN